MVSKIEYKKLNEINQKYDLLFCEITNNEEADDMYYNAMMDYYKNAETNPILKDDLKAIKDIIYKF